MNNPFIYNFKEKRGPVKVSWSLKKKQKNNVQFERFMPKGSASIFHSTPIINQILTTEQVV